jgi:hypothetical protein
MEKHQLSIYRLSTSYKEFEGITFLLVIVYRERADLADSTRAHESRAAVTDALSSIVRKCITITTAVSLSATHLHSQLKSARASWTCQSREYEPAHAINIWSSSK